MYQKAIALWHALSAAEKQEWESLARPKHMSGYAFFLSQALKPNPGLYLPLQGGTMAGNIDMAKNRLLELPLPTDNQEAASKSYVDDSIPPGDSVVHCYGYDGEAWQTLLVESDVLKNLRVKLYDGANGIDAGLMDKSYFSSIGLYGLHTNAKMFLHQNYATNVAWNNAFAIGDNNTGSYFPPVGLWGFNGAQWDRLRTYGTGTLKVGRAAIDSTTKRVTAAGAVIGGARELYWIACSPDDPNAEFELSDAIEALQPIVYDHFDTDKHSDHLHFDPPMKFATGIWVEKFDHMKSLVFCYI